MVLSKTTPKERAAIVTKFVNVGKELNQLTNLLSVQSNFGEYRKALNGGVHLKDLVAATCCGADFEKTLTVSPSRFAFVQNNYSYFFFFSFSIYLSTANGEEVIGTPS
ncbi:unnamed protein product [Nippostrongylus brasiliensis]|uniref:FH2 domain-containing protein n=1 Tax=Nippostrongylus brasiliensis TaxID=27835 RepID=A0A0N4YQQ4_NIPBR|nr:unnamed protein product [Nippostrongylus brasiliensis]